MNNKTEHNVLHSSEYQLERYIFAEWPAPKNVKALVTTRKHGASVEHYQSFNLATHVEDKLAAVEQNRQILQHDLKFKKSPFWLNQTHSPDCVAWQETSLLKNSPITNADACFSQVKQQVCGVLTADCLPILLTNKKGDWVAACHAGWRGLANGVIQNTIKRYQGDKSDLIAWIGPAITQKYFEVGEEVKALFIQQNPLYQQFFEINSRDRYQFDFISLAKMILINFDIKSYGGNLCSFSEPESFYSFRRDPQTGRMASLIWFE